jgi:hypothetical protein
MNCSYLGIWWFYQNSVMLEHVLRHKRFRIYSTTEESDLPKWPFSQATSRKRKITPSQIELLKCPLRQRCAQSKYHYPACQHLVYGHLKHRHQPVCRLRKKHCKSQLFVLVKILEPAMYRLSE